MSRNAFAALAAAVVTASLHPAAGVMAELDRTPLHETCAVSMTTCLIASTRKAAT